MNVISCSRDGASEELINLYYVSESGRFNWDCLKVFVYAVIVLHCNSAMYQMYCVHLVGGAKSIHDMCMLAYNNYELYIHITQGDLRSSNWTHRIRYTMRSIYIRTGVSPP